MTHKHTEGPWRVDCIDDNETPGIAADSGRFSIVVAGFKDENDDGGVQGKNREQELANARLIAAAPDLLEALEEVLPYIEGDTKVPWRKALAAINSATGNNQNT